MNYDDARLFLYRVLPWSPVGDPNAYVNIHWTFQGKGYDRPAWNGRACASIEECIRTIQWAARLPDTLDIYVCMSTQREMDEVRAASGRVHKKAVRNSSNAVQLRVLWLDIDINDGHHKSAKNNPGSVYQSRQEAVAAFAKFLQDSGIPQPTAFVSTGSGGLHCYWVIDQALTIDEWQPLAFGLAEATRRFGLKCDTQCTVDSVRVMRMPDTKHSKHGTMAELYRDAMLDYDYSLDQMRHALSPYMGAQVIPLNPRGNDGRGLSGSNAALAGGITVPQAAPINLRTVADAGCGFIRTALDTGGRDYAQPLWNLTTLCAVFSEGGRDDAHTMAAGYVGYDPKETDALYDRKVREREEKNLGWPSCASIENAGCASCSGCPLKGPNTRPLQFGRPAVATVQPPVHDAGYHLPFAYSHSPTLVVSKRVVAADGTSREQAVWPFPIWEGWLQDEPWTLHFKTAINFRPRKINLTVAQVNSKEGFGRAIGLQGFAATPDQQKLLKEFLVEWIKELQKVRDGVVSSAPFGWSTHDEEVNGFIYNGKIWMKSGEKPAAAPDPVLAAQYTPRGKIEPWRAAADMVTNLKSPAHDCIIACAFAGPLVRFTGERGLLVSAFSSGSGVFKTAAMRVAQAVWGSPHTAMQGLTDTSNQVLNKIGALKVLPMFWDELKTEQDTAKFINMTFQLTSGKEKGRLNADATQRQPGTWQTLMVSASNESILDAVARATKSTTAGLYRVFEYEVKRKKSELTSTAATQMLLKINDHYGQPGIIYSEFLGKNYDRIHAEVAKAQEMIERTMQAKPDERFWVAAFAVLLLGAQYANELGLTNIDEGALAQHLMHTFIGMRQEVHDTPADLGHSLSVIGVLGKYLNQHRVHHTLYTNKMPTGAGKPTGITIKMDASRLGALYIQIAMESKLMRIQVAHFKEWLSDLSYSPKTVYAALEDKFGARKMIGRLGSGTQYAGVTEQLLELDLNHSELSKFCEY